MADPTNLLNLAQELQEEIISNLEWPDRVCLKLTCKHYNQLIPSLDLNQLLEAEKSAFSEQRDLYACRYCLRLRDGTEFADKMLKRTKGRGHGDAAMRFCVECGLNAPKGTTRYSPGTQIRIGGVTKVICDTCKSFKPIGKDIDGNEDRACVDCQAGLNRRARLIRETERERKLAIERETRRLERERRRARRREVWGSDYSDSEDQEEPWTWEDEDMYLIQAQADQYMNSPKASD